METTFLERRKEYRFRGALDVELEKGSGITHDLSASGVYFVTDQSFAPAEPIEFFLNLEHSDLGPLVRVRCLGEIVRVNSMGKRMGVAVAVSSYSFAGSSPGLSNHEDRKE